MLRETPARSSPYPDRHSHVLATVADRGDLTVDGLAAALADRLGDDRDAAVTRHEVALVHRHLPRLDDAGLIEYDRERGTVRARAETPEAVDQWYSDHGGWGPDRSATEPTGSAGSTTPDRWRDRRRTIRAVLAARGSGERIALSVLAVAVGERDTAATDHGTVRATLHHVHLPKLDTAGVLDYDAETKTVTCRTDEPADPIDRPAEERETAVRQRPDDGRP